MGSTGQQAGRLVDYFAVCGLDLSTGLQPGQFSGKMFTQSLLTQLALTFKFHIQQQYNYD